VLDHEQDTCVQGTSVTNRSQTIQRLNDAFRKTGVGGLMAMTPGIKALGPEALATIVTDIRCNAEFTADNDPYGEHDMATVKFAGERIFWKIDYYDKDLACGSPDPADPAVTTRVMTIMLASEY
jgi:hypothetical protein